ncbi:hypothetical protein [Nocardioides zeae]
MTQATPPAGPAPDAPGLVALVVDDEQPARDELAWLLERHPRIGRVVTSPSATEALRVLHEGASTWSSSTSRCPASRGSSWPACSPPSASRPRWCS